MRCALVMVFACFAGCQCGGVATLRLSGPEVLLRGGAARLQASVLDADGRAQTGTVTIISDVGSLRSGGQVVLGPDGSGDVELRCTPSEDADCAGEFVVVTATWREQQVERRVRLVDVLPMSGSGGGAMGGGTAGGSFAGGGAAGGAAAGGVSGGGAAGGAVNTPGDGGCDQGGTLSSLGCEFLVTAVPPENTTKGSCYAVVLANGNSHFVDVRVEHDGRPLLPYPFIQLVSAGTNGPTYTPVVVARSAAQLPGNQVAVLFLGEEPTASGGTRIACPVAAALSQGYQTLSSSTSPAFRITTSAPVAAYDIYPYGGARSAVASASLLLPVTAWSTTSVALTPAPSIGPYHSYLQLFAAEDGTELNIEAPVAIQGGVGVPPSLPRQVVPRVLARFERLQLHQSEELGGSTIRSNKPVAVWAGHTCMLVPAGFPACDSAHQQLPPVAHLGNEYVAVRPPSRTTTSEDAVWRLVGTARGTTLTYTPPMLLAPKTLGPGQAVEFSAPGPFVVRSQDALHPFLATQLMTGASRVPNNEGDPDFVLLVPPGQFLNSYLFFTDHTYRNTHLVFVRRRTASGSFAQVTLDCGDPLQWAPTGDPKFEYAIRSWRAGDMSGCTNGIRRASSTEPFGLTVWGTDFFVSYAYPAGMGVNQLNTIDPDPIP